MKKTTMMVVLVLGTIALTSKASMDYSYKAAADRAKGPDWKDHQFPPSRDNNWGWKNPEPDVTKYSAVPEAGEIFAAALLLLPLGASTIRVLRRDRQFCLND
jgi:hypothetical protein